MARLLEHLCAAGLLTGAHPLERGVLSQAWAQAHGVLGAIEGTTRLEGRTYRVRLAIPSRFPNVLPKVFVLELGQRLPHVLAHGYVCYSEHDGVLLDRHDPVAIVAEALRQALELVAAGLRGENKLEYIEELALHWPADALAVSALTLTDEIRWVCGVRTDPLWRFFDDRADAQRTCPGQEAEQVLYIPLPRVPQPLDPFPEGAWRPRDITRFILQNLDDEQRRSLHARLRGSKRTRSLVVVRVVRPRGGVCLIGVEYHDIQGDHPLTKRGGTTLCRQIRVVRQDHDYFIARGGGLAEVRRCKALLVGCGAVGGHIAGELARAGVQQLTLIDPDELRPENAYRHVLGHSTSTQMVRALLGPPFKAAMLMADLKDRYSALEVGHIVGHIEVLLQQNRIKLDVFDFVVVATGDPNVDRWINEVVLRSPTAPPVVYSWLEPLGLGGHAILIPGHNASEPRGLGCLDCLFTPAPEDRTPPLCNRAAFAEAGQAVTRELAACGQAFTPFGSLDAVRTAELAARLAVDVAAHGLRGPVLRSWKGDPKAFRAAGYRTSSRFEASSEELERASGSFAQHHCPVCAAVSFR